MAENVVIDFTSQTKGIKDADDALARLGKTDAKNADQFAKNNKAWNDGVKKNTAQLDNFKGALNHIGKLVLAAFAVEQVIAFGKESVKAFRDAELTAKKLEFAVKKIANGTDGALDVLIRQSKELEKISIFSDDDIQKAQTMLIQFGLTTAEAEKLLPKLIDVSSALGETLPQAVDRAIGGINGITKANKDIGANFKDTGDKTQNLNILMEKLGKFTGSTAVALQTSAGSTKNLDNQINNLQESIGSRLAPVLDRLKLGLYQSVDAFLALFSVTEGTKKAGNEFEKFGAQIEGTAQFLSTFAAKVEGFDSIKDFTATITELQTEMRKLDVRVEGQKKLYDKYRDTINLVRDAQDNFVLSVKKTGSVEVDITKLSIEQLKKRRELIEDHAGEFKNLTISGESKLTGEIDKELERRNKLFADANAKKLKKQEQDDAKALAQLNKYLDDTYQLAMNQLGILKELSESDESPLEQENRLYEERLRAAGIFYKSFEEMTELEQDAYTSSMQVHLENIAEIEGNSDQQRYDRLVAFNEQRTEADKAYYDAKVELLEAENNALIAGSQIVQQILGQESGFAKAFFIFEKIVTIGKIVQALQVEKAGYYTTAALLGAAAPALAAGFLATAVAKAQGANIRAGVSIATVGAQAIPALKFAKGTKAVEGGRSGEDSVNALLMPGEMVIPTQRKKNYNAALTAIFDEKIAPSVINEFVNSYQKNGANFNANANVNARIDEYLLGRVFSGSNKGVIKAIDKLGRSITPLPHKLIARKEGWL